MMNKYPAIGSPCLHPLPTWILGVGKPLMRMEDWKFLRRELIQWMYLGLRLNNLSVFSINSKEMLSNALEKSICSMSPGRLLSFACWKRSNVFLVMSPMYLPGRYAFCQGCISLSRRGFSLWVRTPDAIL